MAISTGQLDIGQQKMVLLIAGVSSQDQPEKREHVLPVTASQIKLHDETGEWRHLGDLCTL